MDADASHNKPIAMMYGVKSFPTIKFFGKGNENKENPVAYTGPRTEQGFVDFLNQECGTQRAVGGGLHDLAGRLPSLDELAQKFITATGDVRATLLREAKTLGEDAQGYIRVMEKIAKNSNEYIGKEMKRCVPALQSWSVLVSNPVIDWNPFLQNVLWGRRNLTRLRSSSTFSPLSSKGRFRKRSPELRMNCDHYPVFCSTSIPHCIYNAAFYVRDMFTVTCIDIIHAPSDSI